MSHSPENGASELKGLPEGLKKVLEAPTDMPKSLNIPDNDLVAKQAIDSATEEATAQGKALTEAEKKQVGYDAKLEAWRRHDERAYIQSENPNSSIFTPTESMPLAEYLSYPEVLGAITGQPGGLTGDLENDISVKGLFPNLEKTTIHKGEHLVVAPGGKSIQIVRTDPETNQIAIVAEGVEYAAKGERSDEALAQNIDKAKGYKMVAGRVKFNTPKDLREKTLGAMFKDKSALVVNGNLAIKSDKDSEFHRVIEKSDGTVTLKSRREYVINGTRVEDAQPSKVAEVKAKLTSLEG